MAAERPVLFDIDAIKAADGSIKGKMRAQGIRLGKCKCPSCRELQCVASLNGPRDHLHLSCRACGFTMME